MIDRRHFLVRGVHPPALCWRASRPLRDAAGKANPSTRPNIVVIVVDDMRFDEFGAGGHPYLETPHIDALARSARRFATPITRRRCARRTAPASSPANTRRATASSTTHRARTRVISCARSRASCSARATKPRTRQVAHGKRSDAAPGLRLLGELRGPGRITEIRSCSKTDACRRVPGYITDLLTDRAIAFATRPRRRPFMVYIGHKAIHPQIVQRDDGTVDVATNEGFVPAARHRGSYAGKTFRRRPNYGLSAQDRAGKPVLAAALDAKHSGEIAQPVRRGSPR